MILTLDRQKLRTWLDDPRVRRGAEPAAGFFGALLLSAAGLVHYPQPLAMGLICSCTGRTGLWAALGGCAGYLLFWGSGPGVLWSLSGGLLALLLGGRAITRRTPLLLPAAAVFCVALTGLWAQARHLEAPIPVYLLQVGLAGASTALFSRLLRTRSPVCRWLSEAAGVLALAQLSPLPFLNFGTLAAGVLVQTEAFPAAALAGAALDLAGISPVPMTAVLTGCYLMRFLPLKNSVRQLMPGAVYLLTVGLCGHWDIEPLPSLLLGSFSGCLLPVRAAQPQRRGETGVLQVRLEMTAGVLQETSRLLQQVRDPPVDGDSLVRAAAQRACSGCPCRKNCRDSTRISELPALILEKPLRTPQELPVVCRKSGRLLGELRTASRQLRSIQADRQRLSEYRGALLQQYRFLSCYLQQLSDGLSRRPEPVRSCWRPRVFLYGNRPRWENGDFCQEFPGVGSCHYVLLCDGMGTGPGAVRDGRSAADLLRRLLQAGFPPEHALRSLNSLCALSGRAGAVAVDLARLDLAAGQVTLYKWGAAPSFLMSSSGVRRVGTPGAPPGLSAEAGREQQLQLTLHANAQLVMVSDGIDQTAAFALCSRGLSESPGELAARLMDCTAPGRPDDATAVMIRLEPLP